MYHRGDNYDTNDHINQDAGSAAATVILAPHAPSTVTITRYAYDLRRGNVAEQYHALNELRKLSSASSANKDAIRERGAIAPAVALLRSGERDIQLAALYLLRSLSVNTANQAAIAESGAIPHLLRCLESDVEALHLNASATLWNLAADPENKATIGDTGGVALLLSLLRRSDSQRVHNEVCGALRNLSYRYDNLRHFAEFHHGIKLLVDLLWSPHDHIRKNVAVALNMCMQHPAARSNIEREQCLSQLLMTLDQFQVELTPQTAKHSEAINRAQQRQQYPQPQQQQQQQHQHPTLRVPAPAVGSAAGVTMPNQEQAIDNAGKMTTQRRNNSHVGSLNNTCNSLAPHAYSTLQAISQDMFGSIAWNGLELDKKIGKGAFSDVFRARYHGYPVAVKLLREKLPDDERKRERLLQEYRMLAALRHPNVVLLMGTSLSPEGKPVFVSELCSRGALKDVLPQTRSMLRRLQFAKDIVHGLNWLHAHNIVHRDLKCANILVDEQYTAKISDLGLALLYYEGVHCPHFKGNLKYSAPEILAARADRKSTRYPYGPQTDVYSFALILWELVTRKPLFEGINGKEEIMAYVCAGERPPLVPGWPLSLQKLLSASWHDNPNKRPEFTSIQRDFPSVMVDVMCPDPVARKVCRALWAGMETRKVPYHEFESVFQQQTLIDLANASLCYRRCLQAMLCDPYDHCVTFERVCNLVHTFGPMDDVMTFVNNVVTLFEQPWFFGYVRVCDAKQMLIEQWEYDPSHGYYLFRFSDNLPGSFSIFTIDVDGNTSHRRVGHQYSSDFFVTIDNNEHVFRDLYALHDFCAKIPSVFGNKAVLPGAPYQCLFVANPLRESSESARTAQKSHAAAAPAVSVAITAAVGTPSEYNSTPTAAAPSVLASRAAANMAAANSVAMRLSGQQVVRTTGSPAPHRTLAINDA